jgi:BMFP domain-containing protein YqiC
MGEEQDRPKDAGEAIREGVRSITGMLGALKEAIEETFDELRGVDTTAPETPGASTDSAPSSEPSSAFRKAQETVEEVRDRFDFVTRREFEALRRQLEELRARLDERDSPASSPEAAAATPPPGPGTQPPSPAAEPPPAEPTDPPAERYRFEVD